MLNTPLQQFMFTGLTCFLTGYIPSVSTEVILASLGLFIPTKMIVPLAFMGALTQTVAKTHLYFLSKKFLYFLSFNNRRRLIKLKKQYHSKEKLSAGIIFFSALTGLPPYYLINLLCGIINTGWLMFATLGFTGMFIRFWLCLAFPQVIMHYLGS